MSIQRPGWLIVSAVLVVVFLTLAFWVDGRLAFFAALASLLGLLGRPARVVPYETIPTIEANVQAAATEIRQKAAEVTQQTAQAAQEVTHVATTTATGTDRPGAARRVLAWLQRRQTPPV